MLSGERKKETADRKNRLRSFVKYKTPEMSSHKKLAKENFDPVEQKIQGSKSFWSRFFSSLQNTFKFSQKVDTADNEIKNFRTFKKDIENDKQSVSSKMWFNLMISIIKHVQKLITSIILILTLRLVKQLVVLKRRSSRKKSMFII